MAKKHLVTAGAFLLMLALLVALGPSARVAAQNGEPEAPILFDPTLQVDAVVDGLTTPIGMAFLGQDEFFVIEKNTGQVKHVVGGAVDNVVLDLAVNASSERGLLGITLHPDFANNGHVYLYWTCWAPAPTDTPYFPSQIECTGEPALGEDSEDVLAVPLLGNRVDRFVWDGAALTWDMNITTLRVFQNDAAPIPRDQGDEEQAALGNHDGGVITFGPDGKLYVMVGDVGRRGMMQNLPFGPISYVDDDDDDDGDDLSLGLEPTLSPLDESGILPQELAQDFGRRSPRTMAVPDDQFGGPYPDDAHFTGVILRLNDDGSVPDDNPFHRVGDKIGGEIGENIQMTFAYGIRNSFGMDFDPLDGHLWMTENGEDAFDELNLVHPGFNSGWIQIMGPLRRIDEYREIETTEAFNEDFPNLQQLRWGPENIADSRGEARRRLFRLPGSHYSDPEFSWKYATAPAAIGFVGGDALGEDYEGDLFMGFSIPDPLGGPLFHFELESDRKQLELDDDNIEDRVADNETVRDLTESESFLIGANFGVVTDIQSGPDGNLHLVSLSNGAVYEISARETPITAFQTALTGEEEAPGPGDEDGRGMAWITVDEAAGEVCFALFVANIGLPATGAHIHIGEEGVAGPVVVGLVPPGEGGSSSGCVAVDDQDLLADIIANPDQYYVNVHSEEFPAGAVRGQLPD